MTDFNTFWALYPRKKGKGAARKAWDRAVTLASPEDIMAGLECQLAELKSREPQFRPHPATWLNQERWEDEPDTIETPFSERSYADWTDDEKRMEARTIRNAPMHIVRPNILQALYDEGYLDEDTARARAPWLFRARAANGR